MSTTAWPHRPPEPVTHLAARWEGTPGTPADLAGIRRELRAAIRHRPWPASFTQVLVEQHAKKEREGVTAQQLVGGGVPGRCEAAARR